MKNYVSRIVIVLALSLMLGTLALAKSKSTQVTFAEDVMVGNTLVQKGTYTMSYDEKTGELSIIGKNKAVIAKATVHPEKLGAKVRYTETSAKRQDNSNVLQSVTFEGQDQSLILGATSAQNPTEKKTDN